MSMVRQHTLVPPGTEAPKVKPLALAPATLAMAPAKALGQMRCSLTVGCYRCCFLFFFTRLARAHHPCARLIASFRRRIASSSECHGQHRPRGSQGAETPGDLLV